MAHHEHALKRPKESEKRHDYSAKTDLKLNLEQ